MCGVERSWCVVDDALEGGKSCLALLVAAGLLGLVLLLLAFPLGLALLLLLALLLGLILGHALLVLGLALRSLLLLRLLFRCRFHRGWRVGGALRHGLWLVHGALWVKAHRHRASGMSAEDDDGGFGAGARRLGIRVFRGEFAVLVDLQGSGVTLLGSSPSRLDGDKLRPCGKLSVDVGRHLGLVAWRVKALVALHVVKQARIVSATPWAGDTRSGFRLQQCVLAVKRGLGKVQVEVRLYPCRQVFGG